VKIYNVVVVFIVGLILSACGGGGGGGATPTAVTDGYRGLYAATGEEAGVASVDGVDAAAVYTYNFRGTPVDVTLNGLEAGGFVETKESPIARYIGGTTYGYSRFGVVASYDTFGTEHITNGEVFYVGQKTSSMPTTGEATYNGMASSLYEGAFINNDIQIFVDYGVRTITGRMDNDPIFGEDVLFDGTIEGSDFSGDLAATYDGTTYDNAGTFSGSFFGPDAAELGGVGVLSDGVDRTIAFSFGAEKEGL
jgi:hypothetical protein